MPTTIRPEDALEQTANQVEQDNACQALTEECWARIELAPEVLGDVGRFLNHIAQYNLARHPGASAASWTPRRSSPTAR